MTSLLKQIEEQWHASPWDDRKKECCAVLPWFVAHGISPCHEMNNSHSEVPGRAWHVQISDMGRQEELHGLSGTECVHPCQKETVLKTLD